MLRVLEEPVVLQQVAGLVALVAVAVDVRLDARLGQTTRAHGVIIVRVVGVGHAAPVVPADRVVHVRLPKRHDRLVLVWILTQRERKFYLTAEFSLLQLERHDTPKKVQKEKWNLH